MTCTVYVAFVWDIIYWMIIIIIIIIMIMIMIIIITTTIITMMIMNDDNNNNNNDNNTNNDNDNNDNNNNDNSNNNDDASGCFFANVTFTAVAEISIRGDYFFKSYHKFIEFNLFFIHLILFWIDELIHLYSIYLSSMNIEFHLWYENYRRHFQIYLQWRCLNFN